MILSEEIRKKLETELVFSASRSSGPGGQNVNKVNTRVELRFRVESSGFLDALQKEKILQKWANRINAEGELILTAGSERSQGANKEKVTERFFRMLENALEPVKKRIKTSPTMASQIKRLETKKLKSQRKQFRKPPEIQ